MHFNILLNWQFYRSHLTLKGFWNELGVQQLWAPETCTYWCGIHKNEPKIVTALNPFRVTLKTQLFMNWLNQLTTWQTKTDPRDLRLPYSSANSLIMSLKRDNPTGSHSPRPGWALLFLCNSSARARLAPTQATVSHWPLYSGTGCTWLGHVSPMAWSLGIYSPVPASTRLRVVFALCWLQRKDS